MDNVLDWILAQPTADQISTRTPQTLVGRDDSAVQRAGAEFALPRAGTLRWEVYEFIRNRGLRGATFSEIEAGLGKAYSSVGPRVRELKKDGHVESAGGTREGASGAQQEIWLASAVYDDERLT